MHQVVNITNHDIQYAQKILLSPGEVFNDQRIDFIKNLDTIDVQAVPGSGKTTAILAKLLILEKHLPFIDGSGILVLSHTNAAIDEIKEKIYKYCPNLFTYPNFIGTIQSFIDVFFAIPYYSMKYGKKLYRIDNELYSQEHYIPAAAQGWANRNSYRKNDVIYNTRLIDDEEIGFLDDSKSLPFSSSTATYKAILELKKTIQRNGYLSFDDAYILAEKYLNSFAPIKKLIQKRFKLIFVDEMQDMNKIQYNLLERIFYDGGSALSAYQRIGDKNQSIFEEGNKFEEIWEDRDTVLRINGSYRLNDKIAKVVEPFALNKIEIVGLCKNSDNSDIEIKPHIIVFGNDTILEVIPKFTEIIKSFIDEGKIPRTNKNKAIAWSTGGEESKIKLNSYFKNFTRGNPKKKIDHDCLESYLILTDNIDTLERVRKNILNSFLKILRLEKVTNHNERLYTKREMLDFILYNNPNDYENIKLKIYQWSLGIIRGNVESVFEDIKNYIPHFLLNFKEGGISKSREFIETKHKYSNEILESSEKDINVFHKNGIHIEIGTVHSVKGQTLTSVLYLESFYYNDGGISYESQRLKDQFLGNDIDENISLRSKQSAKMVYVGFSRPTHLLCFAVHKDRFENYLSDLNSEVWEIVRL